MRQFQTAQNDFSYHVIRPILCTEGENDASNEGLRV